MKPKKISNCHNFFVLKAASVKLPVGNLHKMPKKLVVLQSSLDRFLLTVFEAGLKKISLKIKTGYQCKGLGVLLKNQLFFFANSLKYSSY